MVTEWMLQFLIDNSKITKLYFKFATFWSLWKLFIEVALQSCPYKFSAEYPRQSVISIKLQSSFIKTALWYRCSPVNLLHICFIKTPMKCCFCIHVERFFMEIVLGNTHFWYLLLCYIYKMLGLPEIALVSS